MMMAFVPTFATVGLGELDLAVLNTINRPNMNAVGSDHFHMLFDLNAIHLIFLHGSPQRADTDSVQFRGAPCDCMKYASGGMAQIGRRRGSGCDSRCRCRTGRGDRWTSAADL